MSESFPLALKQSLPDFADSAQLESPHTHRYRQFYHIDFSSLGVQQRLGKIAVAGYDIAVDQFTPPPLHGELQGRVLLLHGYLEHHGLYDKLISYLLSRQQQVICIDLPGHGLSSGDLVAIDDFDDYQAVLKGVIEALELGQGEQPLHLLGQSTGCAIINQYLLENQPDLKGGSVIEFAPLVRAARWEQVKLLQRLLGLFLNQVPRRFKDSSCDPEFIRFMRQDPLQSQTVSARWVGALMNWVPRFMALPTSQDYTPLICQGEGDTTVDWRYNLEVLQQKFPKAQLLMLAEAQHQLANELPAVRQQIFTWLDAQVFLKEQS